MHKAFPLSLAAAVMGWIGCATPPAQQVGAVTSPGRQHVAMLMHVELHGAKRALAWFSKAPATSTSLVVLDNDPPYTVATPGQPIVYRRLAFTSTCSPQDFAVRWVDDHTVSVLSQCPANKLYPAKTPANGIDVTYAGRH